jgi:choline/glycine/proline betaine transport protein/glycine betaine transporter
MNDDTNGRPSVLTQLRRMDPVIFGVSAILTVAFVLWGVLDQKGMIAAVGKAFTWTTVDWGWLYLLSAFAVVIAALVAMFGRYGAVKLSRHGEKPEFSDFAWFAMLFGAAIAAGIVFWGPAEPAYDWMTVPPYFHDAPMSSGAAVHAMTYSFFHWGLTPWAIYAVLTVAVALGAYRKGLPFRFSTAFYYVIGDRVRGGWGKVLDIFAVIVTLGGLATTTGLIAFQLSAGLKFQYGLVLGKDAAYLIIGLLTLIFAIAAYTGLHRGIKFLGTFRTWVFIAIWLFVLLLGPTLFLINLTIDATGQYLLNLVPMSLYTGIGDTTNWLGSWTIFYWAWWMAWAPFVAVFIARISKGRSVRQLVAFTLLLPSLADMLWYGVIGGSGIKYNITGALKKNGVESAIFATAHHLPLTSILVVVILVLIVAFFLTVADSASVSLAMFTSREEDPNKYLRLFWAIALGAVAAVLAATGSLQAVQTASIVTAFPMAFLLFVVIYAVFRGLNEEIRDSSLQDVAEGAVQTASYGQSMSDRLTGGAAAVNQERAGTD